MGGTGTENRYRRSSSKTISNLSDAYKQGYRHVTFGSKLRQAFEKTDSLYTFIEKTSKFGFSPDAIPKIYDRFKAGEKTRSITKEIKPTTEKYKKDDNELEVQKRSIVVYLAKKFTSKIRNQENTIHVDITINLEYIVLNDMKDFVDAISYEAEDVYKTDPYFRDLSDEGTIDTGKEEILKYVQ